MAEDGERLSGDYFSLSTLWKILWAGRWFTICATLVILGLAALYISRVSPTYTAYVSLLVEGSRGPSIEPGAVGATLRDLDRAIATEAQVLSSRRFARAIIARLSLDEDPEFNPEAEYEEAGDEEYHWTLGSILDRFGLGEIRSATSDDLLTEEDDLRAASDDAVVVDTFLSSYEVVAEAGSDIIMIAVSTGDAEKSALIANTIAEHYMVDRLDARLQAAERAAGMLGARVAELRQQVEAAEEAVKRFSASGNVANGDILPALQRQLGDLKERRERAAIDNDMALSERLGVAISEVEARIEQHSSEVLELRNLERELQARTSVYELAVTRLKQLDLEEGLQRPGVELLSPAEPPLEPSSPNVRRTLVLATFLGGMLGVTAVFLREITRARIRYAEELEALSGARTLGLIPAAPLRWKSLASYLAAPKTSLMSEALRNLRTNIMMADGEPALQALLCVSALPGEGKTVQSVALAQSFGAVGKRVLLIEADLRWRSLSKQLHDPRSGAGLVSVLLGRTPMADAIRRGEQLGIDWLPAEATEMNPADLFSGDSFHGLLVQARQHYDVVIVDGPPVLIVPDVQMLAATVDGILFIARWDVTKRAHVSEAMEALRGYRRKVVGSVLCQVPTSGSAGRIYRTPHRERLMFISRYRDA